MMDIDRDRDKLESRRQEIEARLRQIAAASGLDRELCRDEVERLSSEQDALEYVLGFERPADAESRRWSVQP
jgi:hypothetical protein